MPVHICQFQQIVSQFFRDQSKIVAKWPLPFLVGPALVTVGLTVCLVLRRDQLEEKATEDRLSLFLPENIDAMQHVRKLKRLFPPKDPFRDAYDVFQADYAFVIVEDAASTSKNVLRNEILRTAARVHQQISQLKIRTAWLTAAWSDICYRKFDSCLMHPIVALLNGSDPFSNIQYFLKYPRLKIGNETIKTSSIFGSVSLDSDSMIQSAEAMRIPYLMRDFGGSEYRYLNYLWQKEFLKLMRSLKYDNVNLYYSTSISWAEEIDRNGQMILPYLPILFVVLVMFSVSACFVNDWVVSKPWLGLCGILNAVFAVLSTFGTLVIVGYPFIQMVFIMPFLILSISVDNMFLMLSGWRNTHPLKSVEERMSSAVGETAVSIMITALTDGLSFSIGSISQFPAVRIFCTYCALAVLYVFVYQMTFFAACIALTGRREEANRHCITHARTVPRSQCRDRSLYFRLLCAGGTSSSEGGEECRRIPGQISTHFLTKFLSTIYADALSALPSKIGVILMYLCYVAGAIYGLIQLPLGLELTLLVPRDSYVAKEFRATTRHFSSYGSYAYALIEGDNLMHHKTSVSNRLRRLFFKLAHTEFSEGGQFWLQDFHEQSSNRRSFNSETAFVREVRKFLNVSQFRIYKNDIIFSQQNPFRIRYSKMLIQTRNVGFGNQTAIAKRFRGIFKASKFKGFVYEPNFLLVDQQESTLHNILQNIGLAVGVMLLIAILFIPKFLSALWIGLSILSINIGVVGGLAVWNVRLDIVTMITIVMAIGFSVDFVAHITYHFLISRGKKRLHQALKYVGTPIILSALSTILGVTSLIPANAYMIRCFVKTVVLVVGLGVVHGLVFLPVILSIFTPADQYLEAIGNYGTKVSHYLSTNIPRYFNSIKNKRMRAYFGQFAEEQAVTSDESIPETQKVSPASILTPVNRGLPTELRSSCRWSQRQHNVSRMPKQKHAPAFHSASDLYDFLKIKSTQQLAESDYEIYSEVCDKRCTTCSPSGCRCLDAGGEYTVDQTRRPPHRRSVSSGQRIKDPFNPDPLRLSARYVREISGLPCDRKPTDLPLYVKTSIHTSDEDCDRSVHNFRKNAQVFHHQQQPMVMPGGHSRMSNRRSIRSSGRSSAVTKQSGISLPSTSARFDSSRHSSRMYLKRNETPRQSRLSQIPIREHHPMPVVPPPPKETRSRLPPPRLPPIPPIETVDIMVQNTPGPRPTIPPRSISVEHLQSMESLVDSDVFGAFHRTRSGRNFSKQRHLSMDSGNMPGFTTFRGATTNNAGIADVLGRQSGPPSSPLSGNSADGEDSEEPILY